MGIDLYARWNGITKAQKEAQYTGFRTVGAAGYLREAYHGAPYATEVLIPEAFEDAAYSGEENESGALVARTDSDPPSDFDGQPRVLLAEFVSRLDAAQAAAHERGRAVYPTEPTYGDHHANEIAAFVKLVEAKVRKGKTVRIYASA
jgi:hypothetical protein